MLPRLCTQCYVTLKKIRACQSRPEKSKPRQDAASKEPKEGNQMGNKKKVNVMKDNRTRCVTISSGTAKCK